MANWVTNQLYLKHAEDARFVLRDDPDAYNDERKAVDFNILVPFPTEIEVTGGYTKPGDEPAEVDINIPVDDLSLSSYVDKCIAAGFSAFAAEREYKLQKFGASGWYDWRISHWGTKWNAHNVEKADAEDVIIFQTAWAYPDRWAEELAKHADFTLVYGDEDTGTNCGWVTYEGGQLVAHWDTDEIRRRACESHYMQALAMSLYAKGWLYAYKDEDARDNFLVTYELDDSQYLAESVYARRLVEAYDRLPELLMLILPEWLQEREDLEYYAR